MKRQSLPIMIICLIGIVALGSIHVSAATGTYTLTSSFPLKNNVGKVIAPFTEVIDGWKVNPGNTGIIFINVTSTATGLIGQELAFTETTYSNGTFYLAFQGPQPYYISVAGEILSQGGGWTWTISNNTALLQNSVAGPAAIVVAYHSLPFTTPVNGATGAVGFASGNVLTPYNQSVAKVLYDTTNFVLRYPLTVILGAVFLIMAMIGYSRENDIVLELSFAFLAAIMINWLAGNVFNVPVFSSFAIQESPWTFAIYGISAPNLAFSVIIGIIFAIGMTAAFLIAYRRN